MLQVPEAVPGMLQIYGEKGLVITFDTLTPEHFLEDISCFGLSGKKLKEAKKKPFVITVNLSVLVDFEGESYFFKVPEGYRWNGANVPAFAWAIIGQRTDPRFKLASCLHDYLCEHHSAIRNNRYLSTLIFVTCCDYFGAFPDWKLWAMKHSVDNYQKLCGKDLKGKKWNEKV